MMGFVPAGSGTQAAPMSDREAVHQAALDYVEGLYLVDPSRIERSVHPRITKHGFGRRTAGYGRAVGHRLHAAGQVRRPVENPQHRLAVASAEQTVADDPMLADEPMLADDPITDVAIRDSRFPIPDYRFN
jgi:hypothetical protein